MDPIAIILLALTLCWSAFLIYWMIKSHRETKRKQEQTLRELDRAADFPPPLDERRATLVRKSCGTEVIGTRYVECRSEFLLVFEDDFEREIPLSVEEEVYLAIEEGDTGILALSDGKLYSFTLDE